MKTGMRQAGIALLSAVLLSATGLALAQRGSAPGPVRFRLKSPVVMNNGSALPVEYTCDGESASPPLTWSNPPAGTQSYALTMHHIPPGDEAEHVYMVLYNIPASVTALPKNVKDIGTWGAHTMRGLGAGYTPPCSGGGGAKIYTITLYALSVPEIKVEAAKGGLATLQQLRDAIRSKVLDSTYLDVTYLRASNGAEQGGAGGMGAAGGGMGAGGARGAGPEDGAPRQGMQGGAQ